MLESLPPAQERDVIGEIAEMPRIGAAEQALHILPKARECGLRDANSWGGLGLVLFDGDELAESLQAFINASKYGEKSIWKMAGFVWQGHILDLQEMREKALEAYREALNFCGKKSMHHGQYNIEINKTWIQDRIAKPFERPASSV
jgi:tetratricopeptide (TPR) repeat protein